MVSDRDKATMRLVGRDMDAGESHDRGTVEQRAAILRCINADRAKHQLPALTDRAPEEGFYERARSLGMARVDR